MKKKRRINWANIIALLGIILAFWIIASIFDTNIHNQPFTNDYGDFSAWNIFHILLD